MRELQEREALLTRIRGYVDKHGIVNLELDELARELGMDAHALREYFDSKENLVVALIARDRVRQREAFARIAADASTDRLERSRAVWRVFLDAPKDMELLFQSFAIGMRDPQYKGFVHGVDDWVALSQEALIRDGYPADLAPAFATLALAIHRGAMMDYCATGDRSRVNAAMEMWFDLMLKDERRDDA